MKNSLIFLALCLPAAAANFVQAPIGMSGAHGNSSANKDDIGIPSSLTTLNQRCVDPSGLVSGTSLGASSNGTAVSVVYTGGVLDVLDGGCNLLWQSTTVFDGALTNGAATMGADNGAIATDDVQMARFGPTGALLWQTCYNGGTSPCHCPDSTLPSSHTGDKCLNFVSPDALSQLADGSMLVALHGVGIPGYVYNLNSSTGAILGQEYIDPTAGNAQSFVASGKPCVNGQVAFIATNRSDSTTLGRMYAITVNAGVFTTLWKWPASSTFNGPSRSPTCDNAALGGQGWVFVNGLEAVSGNADLYAWNQTTGALIFDCLDSGGSCVTPVNGQIVGNAALDPRGGVWTSVPGGGAYFWRISEVDGSVIQQIATHLIPGNSCTQGNPGSVPSMTTNQANGHIVLISGLNSVACGATAAASYIVVLDVTTGSLISYWTMPSGTGFPEGQFPVANYNGQQEIALTSTTGSLTMVAGPPYGFSVQSTGPVKMTGPAHSR